MDSDIGDNASEAPIHHPIHLREMVVEDISKIFLLGERLFTAEDVPTLYRTWDEYEVVNLFQSETKHCLVAEVGDQVVGFALGTVIEKRKSSWTYGYLLWFGVDQDYQREGVARRLFRQFKLRMAEAGARILLVDTQADNESALTFFRRVGFDNEEEHVYLSMNIDEERREFEERNGRGRH
ncbi:MAG: GNAT family N-acetyltransferase [Pseudomonadota bacterium]